MANSKKNEPVPPRPESGPITDQMEQASNDASTAAGTAVTVFNPNAGSTAVNGKKFKIKQVTRNVLPQKAGQTIYVRITGAIFESKPLKGATGEQAKMAPPEMFEAVNLETGVICLIIANKVLKGQLEDAYPNESYVGKSFAITMNDATGKRYKQFTVYELDEDTDTE